MRSTLNYTDRKKVTRQMVGVHISTSAQQPTLAVHTLDLGSLALPEDSRVALEVFDKSGFQRVELGTVGSLTLGVPTILDPLISPATPRIRIKVSNSSGKLLGLGEDLTASHDDGQAEATQSLLEVREDPGLDEIPWSLDPEASILSISKKCYRALRNDRKFLALVLPECFSQALGFWLNRAAEVELTEIGETGQQWISLGISYAGPLPEFEEDDDLENSIKGWVETASRQFCRTNTWATIIGSDATEQEVD